LNLSREPPVNVILKSYLRHLLTIEWSANFLFVRFTRIIWQMEMCQEKCEWEKSMIKFIWKAYFMVISDVKDGSLLLELFLGDSSSLSSRLVSFAQFAKDYFIIFLILLLQSLFRIKKAEILLCSSVKSYWKSFGLAKLRERNYLSSINLLLWMRISKWFLVISSWSASSKTKINSDERIMNNFLQIFPNPWKFLVVHKTRNICLPMSLMMKCIDLLLFFVLPRK